MRWSALCLAAILGLAGIVPGAGAEDRQDYGILIISRERLEVASSCEIGIYLQGQLIGRLFQEQSASFNLPPGKSSIRLSYLPGQAPGCSPGMQEPADTEVTLRAGDIQKYRIAVSTAGLYLKPAPVTY
ncbi:hypothetical protein [Pseudomonas sp. dw_358]|uniref:hypothetical protein n=1 Tax=Pseudomonas sp. dw_358 TaxID=2720083 RepID=UPI001BD59CD8|nr:hypothetical protein [Pseudomonas sp. dw_358]